MSSSNAEQLDVSPDAASGNENARVEREYRAHHRAVIGMLRTEFPPLWDDADEIYQHSWAELLAMRASGHKVRNVRAMLKKIAWYSARDLAEKRHPTSLDPSSLTLQRIADGDLLPDEQAELRIDAATIRHVIDSLEPREAAALKMRFDEHLPAKEIQRRLGLSPKALEKVMTAAYKRVHAQLQPDGGGEPPWLRRQRSLLLACETGLASARQRRKAQQMVEQDPRCAALLQEMRSTLQGIAPLLPMPVLPEDDRATRHLQFLLDQLSDRLARMKHLPYDLTQRGLPSSSTAEQAGGLGGAAIGAGATAKILALCIAAGGTAAMCIDGAGLFEQHARHPHQVTHKRAAKPPPKRRTIGRVAVKPPPPPHPARAVKPRKPRPVRREIPVSSPRYQPPPSPAPSGSTEFGPGGIGSTSRPTAPAPAPTNGGGEFTP